MNKFAEILLEARTDKDMTKRDVANCISVNESTYSKWELGIHFPKDSLVVKKLAVALGLDYIELLDAVIDEQETLAFEKALSNAKISEGNEDRHLCRICKYRTSNTKKGCSYYDVTGNFRNCDAERCDKFEKGKKLYRGDK